MMRDVCCPENIHFMPSTMNPVIQKIIEQQRKDPGKGTLNAPFKGPESLLDRAIHKDADDRTGRINELTQETSVYRRHSILESIYFNTFEITNQQLQKNHGKKLALLSAKSWVLRNKLYSSIHDPYIYTLNEIENTDVFDDMDDEDQSAIDSLFDDEAPEEMVEVVILRKY